MSPRLRRPLEALLLLGILALVGLIVHRVVRYRGVQAWKARIGEEPDYTQPGQQDVQVTLPGRPHSIANYLSDPESIERRVHFTYSTNALGLRDDEVAVPKPEGTFRIAAVGECVTFGNGVEGHEAWPSLLQESLRERYPRAQVEVVNAGLNQDVRSIVDLLYRVGPKLSPDLVILSPGVGTVFYPEHVGMKPFRLWLDPKVYHRDLGKYREQLERALAWCRERDVELVLFTPTINSFFLPDGKYWLQELRAFSHRHRLPLLDSTALFERHETRDGLVFRAEEGVQELVRYREGRPEVLLELSDPAEGVWIDPRIYAYLDAHPDVSPLLSIDGNHPNPRGHAVLARAILEVLEQHGLLAPLEGTGAEEVNP